MPLVKSKRICRVVGGYIIALELTAVGVWKLSRTCWVADHGGAQQTALYSCMKATAPIQYSQPSP